LGIGLVGTFELLKVVTTVLIMVYAYFFMNRSVEAVERRPWEYLYIATMFLFVWTLLGVLQAQKPGEFGTTFFINLKKLFELAFLGSFLFSFISQHHLLVKRRILLITETSGTSLYERIAQRFTNYREHQEEENVEKSIARMQREKPSIRQITPDKEADEPEEDANVQEAAADDEEDTASLVSKAELLIKQMEQFLKDYQDRIDAAKAAEMRQELDSLESLLSVEQPDPEKIREQMRLLGADTQ
jgi:hypothetical protein